MEKGIEFLPVSREDMIDRGWYYYDFLVVSADGYIDHPSFGTTLIARLLENRGYRVAILPQPDWHSAEAFRAMGKPRYGVLIGGGNLDSMVAHYTVAKRRRTRDLYSEGGQMGKRPDRPTIVYANRAREAFPDTPIVIGGLEASLRRFAHYDYWDDRVRRSILFDAPADLLVYGMGESATVEIARRLARKTPPADITDVPGTAYIADAVGELKFHRADCPSYEAVCADKTAYARATKVEYDEHDPIRGCAVVQPCEGRYLVVNPPARPLRREELDALYALPYTRAVHPMYKEGIPAIEEVQFSIAHTRGCFGSCSFCAITFLQGRIVTSRSHESVLEEARAITQMPGFKGYIHDVGGPTANFRAPACDKQLRAGACSARQCLFPKPCPNLKVDHTDYIQLLRELRALPKVKKVFVRSGLRYDYIMADKSDAFLRELCQYHVSGQLKVAPEHVSPRVLAVMGKPGRDVYDAFCEKYARINREIGKEQYLVPYLISSHPGSDLAAAIELAEYLRDINHQPEQVQDFYPTPGTLSTCMFYTGFDPRTGKPVYVPRSPEEKAMQRALLQFRRPQNFPLVREALRRAGREDLIGTGRNCLVPPEGVKTAHEYAQIRRERKAREERRAQREGGYGKAKGGKPAARTERAKGGAKRTPRRPQK